jgi:hypothetical protein
MQCGTAIINVKWKKSEEKAFQRTNEVTDIPAVVSASSIAVSVLHI